MSLLRDDEEFGGAIDQAAQQLGLSPIFVEKDYWVTETLRALHQRYPGHFVFKGGTSLSKGYGLISRFSEDGDILVTPTRGDSAKIRAQTLQDMTQAVSETLGVAWTQAHTPGRGKNPHRGDIITYQSLLTDTIRAPLEGRGVLLETGFAGGDWPGEMVEITPLVRQVVPESERDGYTDLAPFTLRALKPERTLVEKASLLHHVASNWHPTTQSDDRCGRHYYDIYCLLGDTATRTSLEDVGMRGIFSAHIKEISARHYKDWIDRPADGYASSPAFSPQDPELRKHLSDRYTQANALMVASEQHKWPSFSQVLKRIERYKILL